MKPVLLLDVDGVLAPLADPPPDGYAWRRVGALGSLALAVAANTRRLRRLAAAFDVVWCTARERDAADILGPLHGLPERPWVAFGTVRPPGGPIIVPANPTGGSWKLPGVDAWVRAHAGGRPVAWLDDDLGGDCRAWARARSSDEAPTLLVDVEPVCGVEDRHVEGLLAFAGG